MRMRREHRKQLEEIIHDELKSLDEPDVVITRLWVTDNFVKVELPHKVDFFLSEFAAYFGGRRRRPQPCGFSLGSIKQEKRKRFGSGEIAWA